VAKDLTRREFNRFAAGAVGAALSSPFVSPSPIPGAPHPGPIPDPPRSWPGYDAATVIDFLASPGPFNTPITVPHLSAEMVQNAKASGITAINLTIGGRTVVDVSNEINKWARDIAAHGDVLTNVTSMNELRLAKATGKFGLIYGFQDSVAIGDDLTRIPLYHSLGVRIIQLTYNVRNLVGDGCLVAENRGLTPFGRQVVGELNAYRIVVDTGHTGEQSTLDAIAASAVPIAISHSGCRAVADRPRSKTDATIRKMADRGGVIGIYLMPFLTTQGQPNSDDVIRHIEHAIDVAGEDHVGIGSDLSTTPHVVNDEYMRVHREFVEGRIRSGVAAPGEDPAVPMFVTDLNTPRRLETIAEKLAARKHSSARIEKVIGGNWARLCREVWGG
jgi:membrane dipeptidase